MLSLAKKQVRAAFRAATFRRDGYCCVGCGFQSCPADAELQLDAHHIIPREQMPNGGYVKENGASLCSECHIEAEKYLQLGNVSLVKIHGEVKVFSPENLFEWIGSSREKAVAAAERLGGHA